ncbi:MAG TPA: carboxypeptidase regulatory-like domain-containing protein [Chloroflexota bacterium]|nr:carboxypeptidase regulatory-like domain-containing protein [Chloroflexota bacterium]
MAAWAGQRGKRAIRAAGAVLVAALLWAALTDDVRVWPARNVAQYHVVKWWWSVAGTPAPPATGTLRGVVRDTKGDPIPGARALVTWWDGTAYDATSAADGSYVISPVPAGPYLPVAGAPGYADVVLGNPWLPWTYVRVAPALETHADAVLPAEVAREVAPGRNLVVGEPVTLDCAVPLASTAVRRRITFDSGGRASQLTSLYTPPEEEDAAPAAPWPLLLIVYPGPPDEWECVSLPLAAAGYAVVTLGPAYSFDLEPDVDELARLLEFARAGRLPGADAGRVGLLGGSYSALHIQRLLQRARGAPLGRQIGAVVLLGPPSDIFDVRRRLEQGTFVPPFGLDQALISLGFPDREPLRYWRYSWAFHVYRELPPVALIHSRQDEVVPFQQSERLAAALARMGAPHELHVLEGASHYLLSDAGEAVDVYHLTLAFLGRYLR